MSASQPISKSWRVGAFTCALVATRPIADQPLTVLMEWTPCLPGTWTAAMRRQYEKGRAAAVEDITQALLREAKHRRLTLCADPLGPSPESPLH